MEFVLIPAGTFLMGSSTGRGDERPVREITISKPFYLGKYEVTQEQWVEIMGSNPSHFTGASNGEGGLAMAGKQIGGFFRRLGGEQPEARALKMDPQRPVEMVSWVQVQEFIQRLNAKEGHRKYRLPTEAEWEYAARAGTANFGNDDAQLARHAWCAPNAGRTTHRVGELPSNPWGLYDMHGNVWEWLSDRYGLYTGGAATDPQGAAIGAIRVLRGGAANQPTILCRSAARFRVGEQGRNPFIGFRLARTAE
jgi:formylglycine-generating enzyme required for sulfatase activity